MKYKAGMNKTISIIDNNKEECYICHCYTNAPMHHIFDGIANRPKSELYGLKVRLCDKCHYKEHHQKPFEELKIIGQQTFMNYYDKSIDDFIKIFGKNYL
jgi:Zn-finger protein